MSDIEDKMTSGDGKQKQYDEPSALNELMKCSYRESMRLSTPKIARQ